MPPKKKSRKSKAKTEPKSELELVVEVSEERTFTCFPSLPPELRVKIWRYACFITRNVDIWIKELSFKHFECFHDTPYYFYSSLPVPALLHVNKESRAEGLKHYSLEFATNQIIEQGDLIPFTMSVSTPPRIYVHWNNDRDRLCLLSPYRMDERDEVMDLSGRFKDFADKCRGKGLRYFAINIAQDPDLVFTTEQEEDEDGGFIWYIPDYARLEEVVLIENIEWVKWETCKVEGLEFVDLLPEEKYERMEFAKAALAAMIEEEQEEGGGADQATPLIRTCKFGCT